MLCWSCSSGYCELTGATGSIVDHELRTCSRLCIVDCKPVTPTTSIIDTKLWTCHRSIVNHKLTWTTWTIIYHELFASSTPIIYRKLITSRTLFATNAYKLWFLQVVFILLIWFIHEVVLLVYFVRVTTWLLLLSLIIIESIHMCVWCLLHWYTCQLILKTLLLNSIHIVRVLIVSLRLLILIAWWLRCPLHLFLIIVHLNHSLVGICCLFILTQNCTMLTDGAVIGVKLVVFHLFSFILVLYTFCGGLLHHFKFFLVFNVLHYS